MVRRAVRTAEPHSTSSHTGVESIAVGSISGETEWSRALEGTEAVVHLAARAHSFGKRPEDDYQAYRRINVDGTKRLAHAAAAAGVQRIVFMSSIKVNGERTQARPFTENDLPKPEDAYGITKWEAEQALWDISRQTGLEAVVVRAPLVYGPGVKANFLRLMQLTQRAIPLPLARIRNRRSMIYLGNLVDAIIRCIESPEAAGKTYLVSDGEDISTAELVQNLAAALGVRPRLFPFPPPLLKLGGLLLGKGAEVARLTGSLQVNSSFIRRELGWRPPFSLDQGLRETANWYLAQMNDG